MRRAALERARFGSRRKKNRSHCRRANCGLCQWHKQPKRTRSYQEKREGWK